MSKLIRQKESLKKDYLVFRDSTSWAHIVEEDRIKGNMDEEDFQMFLSAHPLKLIECQSPGILPFQRNYAVVEVVPEYKRICLYHDFLDQHKKKSFEEITLNDIIYANKLVLEDVVTSGKNANFTEFNDSRGIGYIVSRPVFQDVKDGRFKSFFETEDLYRFVVISNNGRAEVQTVPREDQEGRLQLLKYLISCYLDKDPAETTVQKVLDLFRRNKEPVN